MSEFLRPHTLNAILYPVELSRRANILIPSSVLNNRLLTYVKAPQTPGASVGKMAAFIYRCPHTKLRVQGFVANEITENTNTYEPVTCIKCHHVNPFTGKVLGEDIGVEPSQG